MVEAACWFDFSNHVKLRLSGTDVSRFLNGQLTNAINKASEATALEACILNPKGKVNAHLFVFRSGESFLLSATPEQRETLPARLERYIIADDVAVEDVTEAFSLFHLLDVTVPSAPNFQVEVRRFHQPGTDLWVNREEADKLRGELARAGPWADEAEAERRRILAGLPRWGRELTDEIIPVEANLEERCIDYEKGCYIGQEVISRMKMSGQTNKRLCGFVLRKGLGIQEGARLWPLGEEKEVGWITSVARCNGEQVALGYARRGFNEVGTRLRFADGTASEVELVELPRGLPGGE